jgi:hypothetical protein
MQLLLAKEWKNAGGEKNIGVSGHEPDNLFWTYSLKETFELENTQTEPNSSDFHPFLYDEKAAPISFGATEIDNMGVKGFVGWGNGAYFHPVDNERSFLVLPIHRRLNYQDPPIVTYSDGVVTIEQPSAITYDCVRIIAGAENHVIYFDKTGIITYETEEAVVYVQAFKDEINILSKVVEVSSE